MNIWVYVITHDSGAAPNYDPPATTLAICKPRIRKYAKEGDIVLAFNSARGNTHRPHSICWAGVVAEVMPFAEYWRDLRFQNKKPHRTPTPDNIYEPGDGGLMQVRNNSHLPRDAEKDIRGENVLLLQPSWRLGDMRADLPTHFALRMTAGRRGERKTQLSFLQWRLLRRWLDAHTPKATTLPNTAKHCSPCGNRRRPRKRCIC